MSDRDVTGYGRKFRVFSEAMGICAFGIGCAAAIGWASGIESLKNFIPGTTFMRVNTAAGIMVGALSLILLQVGGGKSSVLRAAGVMMAIITIAFGLAGFAEFIFSIDLGVDRLFIGNQNASNPFQANTSFNSSINFILMGFSFLFIHTRPGFRRAAARYLIIAGTVISFTVLVGYACGFTGLYSISTRLNPMSFPGAIAGVCVFVGLWLAFPDLGILRALISKGAGGSIIRKLIIPFALIPLALEMLLQGWHNLGLMDGNTAAGLQVVLQTVIFIWLLLLTARAVGRADTGWRDATEAQKILATFPLLNPFPVAEADLAGRIEYVNPAAEKSFTDIRRLGRAHPWLSDWDDMIGMLTSCAEHRITREVRVGEDWHTQTFHLMEERQKVRIYSMDITLRKKAEEEARVQREWLEVTLSSIADGVIATGTDGRISFINTIAASLTGWRADEALGRSFNDVFIMIDERTRQTGADVMGQAFLEKRVVETAASAVLVSRDGREIPIENSAAPIMDGAGRLTGAVIVFRDVTDKRRAVNSMRESEAALRGVLDASQESIWVFGSDGKILMANAIATKRMGKKPDEIIGRPFDPLMSPELAAARRKRLEQVKESGRPLEFQDTRNGIIFHHNFYPIFDPQGRVDKIACFSTDITEAKRNEDMLRNAHDELERRVNVRTKELVAEISVRKKAEAAAEAERKRLYGVLGSLPVMVCLLNPEYRVVYANRRFTEKFGEDRGKRCHEYIFGHPEPCGFCQSYSVIRTGAPLQWECTGPDGKSILDVYDYPFTDADGSPLVLEMIIDITEQRMAQEAVKAERKRLYDVMETLPVYVILLSADYHVPYANKFFRERFGDSGGKRCFEYLFGRTEPCEVCESFKVMRTRSPLEWEWTGPDKRDYYIYDFPFTDTDGSPLILEVGVDVTEEKSLRAGLEKQTGQLRSLANDLALAEQKERRRLAQILHDHVQQLLVGARLKTSMLRQASRDELPRRIEEVDELISQTLEASRTLTAELSPPILHGAGLVPALRWLARWVREKQGLEITLNAIDEVPVMREDLAETLFQCVKELLFNSAKHSKAGAARVDVSLPDGHIRIVVSDDGVGFDASRLTLNGGDSGGFGLYSIKERIGMAGGSVDIKTGIGAGTCITLESPFSAATPRSLP